LFDIEKRVPITAVWHIPCKSDEASHTWDFNNAESKINELAVRLDKNVKKDKTVLVIELIVWYYSVEFKKTIEFQVGFAEILLTELTSTNSFTKDIKPGNIGGKTRMIDSNQMIKYTSIFGNETKYKPEIIINVTNYVYSKELLKLNNNIMMPENLTYALSFIIYDLFNQVDFEVTNKNLLMNSQS